MFTFSLLYVSFYLCIFVCLLVLMFTQIPLYILTHNSTTHLMVFIQKYLPGKNLIFFLIFSLTGLPPFGLFFVKFNLLAFVLYQTHIFLVIVLFLMFFLNMIFYTQLFNFKNFKMSCYHIFKADSFRKSNSLTQFNVQKTTYTTYSLTVTIISILFCLTFSVIFFTDFFLVVNIL